MLDCSHTGIVAWRTRPSYGQARTLGDILQDYEPHFDLNDFLAIDDSRYAVLARYTFQPKDEPDKTGQANPSVELYCLWDIRQREVPEVTSLLLYDTDGACELYETQFALFAAKSSPKTVCTSDWSRMSRQGWKVDYVMGSVAYERGWDERRKLAVLNLYTLAVEDERFVRTQKTFYGTRLAPDSVSRTLMSGDDRTAVASWHKRSREYAKRKRSLRIVIAASVAAVIVIAALVTVLLPNGTMGTSSRREKVTLSSPTAHTIMDYLESTEKSAAYDFASMDALPTQSEWEYQFHKDPNLTATGVVQDLMAVLKDDVVARTDNEELGTTMLLTQDELVLVCAKPDTPYEVDVMVYTREQVYHDGRMTTVAVVEGDEVAQWALEAYREHGYGYDADREWGDSPLAGDNSLRKGA